MMMAARTRSGIPNNTRAEFPQLAELLQPKQQQLQSGSACFLCLSPLVADIRQGKVPAKIPRSFSLRQVLHHLNLDSVEQAFGGALVREQDLPEKLREFEVVLCGVCEVVSGKLSKLCEELELLQREVNHSLKDFQARFHAERQDGSGKGCLDVASALLRERTKETCALKLKMDSVVPEITLESDVTMAEQQALLINFKLPLMLEIPQERASNNSLTCLVCPREAYSTFGRDILFQRHVTSCHLDYMFALLKFPRLTQEQFKVYCEYLLRLELEMSGYHPGAKKKNTDENPAFVCHYCQDIFHEVKGVLNHLVVAHSEQLAEKLVTLQADTSVRLEELLMLPRIDVFELEGPRYACEDCGRVFAAWSSFLRHRKNPCKNKSSGGSATRNVAVREEHAFRKRLICEYCGLSFVSLSGKSSHVKRMHLGQDHHRDRVACKLCGKMMSKSSLSRHKSNSCPVFLRNQNSKTKNGSREMLEKIVNSRPPRGEYRPNLEENSLSLPEETSYYLHEDLHVEEVTEEGYTTTGGLETTVKVEHMMMMEEEEEESDFEELQVEPGDYYDEEEEEEEEDIPIKVEVTT